MVHRIAVSSGTKPRGSTQFTIATDYVSIKDTFDMFKTTIPMVDTKGADGVRAEYLITGEKAESRSGLVGYGEMDGNGAVPVHRHGNAEEAIVVLEGAGRVVTSRGSAALSPGTLVYSPRNAWHGIETADQSLRVLTIVPGHSDPKDVAYEARGEITAELGPEVKVVRLSEAAQAEVHDPEQGMYHLRVRPGLDGGSVDAKGLVLMENSSDGNQGYHELHRHSNGDEFSYMLEGNAVHLTEDSEVALKPGDLTLTPAGEWHGFRNTGKAPARAVFGFFGINRLEDAGYDLYVTDQKDSQPEAAAARRSTR